MSFLLKISSWKLFLLLVLPAFLTFIPILGEALTLLWIIVYFGWIYSVGISMHNLIPDRIKPTASYFKFNALFSVVGFIMLFIIGGYDSEKGGTLNWLISPLLIYLIWSMFYTFAFAAKMLESVIEGEIVGFSDSVKGFFCFWFFPWGVWYIQPAVKRVLEKYKQP